MTMEITGRAAAIFTLGRHHLLERAPAGNAIKVIDDVLGLNAQGALNYQISLWSRVAGLENGFLPRCLHEERSLARSWLMRDTVHIVPSDRFHATRRALEESLLREWNRWTVKTGRKENAQSWEPLYPLILGALKGDTMTIREIQDTIDWTGEEKKRLLHRLVREMSHKGLLCHATSAGPWYHSAEHSFARVDEWLNGSQTELTDEEARAEIARSYLRTYGPASIADFAYWTGMRVGAAKPIFKGLDGLITLKVEGQRRELHLLEEDLPDLEGSEEKPAPVRLLPQFDALVMGHKDKERLIDPDTRKSIFLPWANVSATILVDGRIQGVWKMTKEKGYWDLEITPFRAFYEEEEEGLESEIDILKEFSGFEIVAKHIESPN